MALHTLLTGFDGFFVAAFQGVLNFSSPLLHRVQFTFQPKDENKEVGNVHRIGLSLQHKYSMHF